MRIIKLLLLLLSASVVADQAYRIVHPDGTVEYTDEPLPGAEPIELQEVITYPAPPKPPTRQIIEEPRAGEKAPVRYKKVEISRPTEESTWQFDERGLTATVKLDPELQPGHKVIYILDGEVVARGGTSENIGIAWRGQHSLKVSVVDVTGRVMGASKVRTFFVYQRSIQFNR